MGKNILLLVILGCSAFLQGQTIKTDQGAIDKIRGINNYKVVFEYDPNLKIPNYDSEEQFIKYQFQKRENKNYGSGEEFKRLWFENRKERYEPLFISEFNKFKLKKRQIVISTNDDQSEYTMLVNVKFIYPGYNVTVFEEKAKLEATITIYRTSEPENILFSTKNIRIHGKPGGDEFDRVETAYGELGRWSSKYFCRKT
ncbi:hypothetical protein B0O79_4025 [Flavobacteriaceae bacterium MAR_2009_75]|nr:hypothetical protein B0O79_4025 [Flavobacteriaceae bacterium MAR_2009_75]